MKILKILIQQVWIQSYLKPILSFSTILGLDIIEVLVQLNLFQWQCTYPYFPRHLGHSYSQVWSMIMVDFKDKDKKSFVKVFYLFLGCRVKWMKKNYKWLMYFVLFCMYNVIFRPLFVNSKIECFWCEFWVHVAIWFVGTVSLYNCTDQSLEPNNIELPAASMFITCCF